MAWSSPSTQTTGDLITASIWNQNVVDNALALYASAMGYVCIEDQKAQNTDGGTFTSGAWQTRPLNTEVSDSQGLSSLAANQVTLAAGTYRVRASAPGHQVVRHQARLQNVTAGTTLLTGTSESTATGAINPTRSFIGGPITVAASQALELQHRCSTTMNTSGFGIACNLTTEVYSRIEFWKEVA